MARESRPEAANWTAPGGPPLYRGWKLAVRATNEDRTPAAQAQAGTRARATAGELAGSETELYTSTAFWLVVVGFLTYAFARLLHAIHGHRRHHRQH